jgi:hypothetical protein
MTRSHQRTQEDLAAGLHRKIAALPGVQVKPLAITHGIVPVAYWVNGTEFVHFHGNSQIDLRVPEERLRGEVLQDTRAKINPYARSRVEFDFETLSDADDAFRFIERVYRLIKAARGTASGSAT